MYGVDVMIPVEINTPTWRRAHFSKDANSEGLNISANLVDEICEDARIREYTTKDQLVKMFRLKVRKREGDLVLKKVTDPTNKDKLSPNWEGPYRVRDKLDKGAYKLENLDGIEIPRIWNVSNLRTYFS